MLAWEQQKERGQEMAYVFTNPNPRGIFTGDCSVRAIAIALDLTWDEAYALLTEYGFMIKDMPNFDNVLGLVLGDRGFTKSVCPNCATVREFARNHPDGIYVLRTGSHVVTVIDGDYYDTWDSGDEIPIMYWRKYGI